MNCIEALQKARKDGALVGLASDRKWIIGFGGPPWDRFYKRHFVGRGRSRKLMMGRCFGIVLQPEEVEYAEWEVYHDPEAKP